MSENNEDERGDLITPFGPGTLKNEWTPNVQTVEPVEELSKRQARVDEARAQWTGVTGPISTEQEQ